MSVDIEIVKAQPEHIPGIRVVTDDVFRPFAIVAMIQDKYGCPTNRDWLDLKMDQLEADLKADPDGFLVALCDGEVAGYVTSVADKLSGCGRIPNLAVSSKYQGKGISRMLMEAAEEYMKAQGMSLLKIETLETNEVCRTYYPRLGFEEIARQIHFVKKL